MPYTIEEHKHRFSAWAASRAASTSKFCRFTVEQGRLVLEAAGLNRLLAVPELLPEPLQTDAVHRQWRHDIITAAQGMELPFTHGVAAKLINVYLKAAFVCGGYHDHERVRALHPPIDSLLLKELVLQNVGGFRSQWKKAAAIRWSKFDSNEYESVIDLLRKAMAERSLWEAEQYWQGFQ